MQIDIDRVVQRLSRARPIYSFSPSPSWFHHIPATLFSAQTLQFILALTAFGLYLSTSLFLLIFHIARRCSSCCYLRSRTLCSRSPLPQLLKNHDRTRQDWNYRYPRSHAVSPTERTCPRRTSSASSIVDPP